MAVEGGRREHRGRERAAEIVDLTRERRLLLRGRTSGEERVEARRGRPARAGCGSTGMNENFGSVAQQIDDAFC